MSATAFAPPVQAPPKTPISSQQPTGGAWGWIGLSYVLFVPILAGLATVRGVEIAGFNYTGVVWIIAFVAGMLLMLIQFGSHSVEKIYFPSIVWQVWVGYLFLSLLWVEKANYLQVQSALQMGMPLLIGTLASLFVRTRRELHLLIRAYGVTLLLLAFWVAVGMVGFISLDDLDPVYVAVRSLALTAVVVGGLFIAGAEQNSGRCWLIWAAALAICVLTGSRMATLAALALPILNPVTRHPLRKLAAVGAVVLAGAIAWSTPSFQERFFRGESGEFGAILEGDFDSAGRFDSWPYVLNEAMKAPWLGHGVGSVQEFLPGVWEEVVHPHNDYLRVFFELGGVGLTLFLTAVFCQMWVIGRLIRRTNGVVRQAFGGAWLGLAVFLLIATTDNPIVYHVWYTNPIFALVGAAYAVAGEEDRIATTAGNPIPIEAGAT
jgi:O-antigen ligase